MIGFLGEVTVFDIIVQTLGILGGAAGIISVQMKKYENIIILRITYALFFAVQYFLLGGIAGVLMNLIAIIRNVFFIILVKKSKSTLTVQLVSSFLFLVAGLLTFDGWMTVLITGARIITSFAEGMTNQRLMRYLILVSCLCWLFYNFSLFSVGGIICEGFQVTSIIVALARFHFFEKTEKEM